MEGEYLILLAQDTYDVFYRSKDGERQEDASSEVFSYFLCSVCPVKTTKPALSFDIPQSLFHNRSVDWLVAPPEVGFLFPAFDDRCANLYGTLYYTRNTGENHPELIRSLFHLEPPMPAQTQRETFQSVLAESLGEDCSYQVVESVHGQICQLMEEHKESKNPEPLTFSKETVRTVLESCGVPQEQAEVFEEAYTREFGEDTQISPGNLVDRKQFQVRTPDVTIQVNPQRRDLLETRILDGVRYILIRAEEGVEVNGVSVRIQE